MSDGFSTALMLLAVGMITVFTILALIVFFGNLLISFVNRYLPEVKTVPALRQTTANTISPKTMAAIVSAVEMATEGKAKVTSVVKTK